MNNNNLNAAKNDFILNLEQNAFSSLSHGIEHYIDTEKPDNLKFAIIHVFHAIELFLKARLAKAHPLLIYAKLDCEVKDDSCTVGFEAIIMRLRNVDVKLTKGNIDDINALRKLRNSIEHHRITANSVEVENCIGRAARFLGEFLEEELEINLKDAIGEGIYNTLSEAIYSYEERLNKANSEMTKLLPHDKEVLSYEFEFCPECNEETIVIPDPVSEDERVHFFFWNAKFYCTGCHRCGRRSLSMREGEGIPICEDCWVDLD